MSTPETTVLDDISLLEISRSCAISVEYVQALVEEGVLTPVAGTAAQTWRFAGVQLRQARVASRLHHDLGVNPPGAALALQLLDEIERLRAHAGRVSGVGTVDEA